MPLPSTSEDFLELVRASKVVDDSRLSACVDSLRASETLPADPVGLAVCLVRNGVLTHDQAEQFLRGNSLCLTIGPYQVLEQLGAGGMGSVFLCEHVGMGRVVAVKILHRPDASDDTLFPPTAKSDADSSSLERFHREALAGVALNHPNIMRVFDIGEDNKIHYLVMEYVDGVSLQEMVRKGGPLTVVRATHYIWQAALGLQHANMAGLVHRDVKPGNIMVNRDGVVKILDLGLARFSRLAQDQGSPTRKLDGTVLGTPDFFAPEQAEDPHAVDIRADIYSLGATFYFCLTGSPPFGQGTMLQKIHRHRYQPPPSVRDHRPDVPEGLAAVITKMLAKDPADRYQSLAEVCTALKPWNTTAIVPLTEQEMPGMSPAARNRLVDEFRKAAPRPSSPEQAVPKLPVRSEAGPGEDISSKRSSAIRKDRDRDEEEDEDVDRKRRAIRKGRDRDREDEEEEDEDDRDRGDERMGRKSKYKPCPQCGARGAQKVLWTAWGSFYGPVMFTHIRCPRCSYCYNGKSGQSNLIPAIIFFCVPLFGILAIIGALIGLLYYRGYI